MLFVKKKRSETKSAHNRFVKGNYINREYSWLRFNERVLEQACAEEVPLLERCKFLSIFCSNLDEFFMVRVGSLINQNKLAPSLKENKTNLTPQQQITGLISECRKLYKQRSQTLTALIEDL